MLKKIIHPLLALLVLTAAPYGYAQEVLVENTENPLAALHDDVSRVLSEANLPFSQEQEHAIVLMMEERRKASEELFGDLNDFQSGPTQGQENDRLQSAILWMRGEFMSRLEDYLTEEQLAAWRRFEISQTPEPSARTAAGGDRPQPAPSRQQTQYVRLNNNAFTSENNGYNWNGGGGGTEVIQRGGAGEWHGNLQFFFQDEKLNAGRRFAQNKPPYQERQTGFDISGPLLPGRLTTGFNFSRNESQNVDTVNATLADGSTFSLGLTKPSTNQNFSTNGVYQLTESNSLRYFLRYQTQDSKNQNVGGYNLPERGSTQTNRNIVYEVRQFSAISSRTLFESSFNLQRNRNERTPVSDAVQINVLDAFNGGGAQNEFRNTQDNYQFSTLFTRLGEKLTIKSGIEGAHRRTDSFSRGNFSGAFTFSSLAAYNANQALTFRINRGTPELKFNQTEIGMFMQNDLKLTPRLTFMYGLRYEVQTNISDRNNFDPRVAFAYGLGKATVIRAGAGVFHQRIQNNIIENQIRQNGTTQYEIVIDNPSFPDYTESGSLRTTYPSIRVLDKDLAAPYLVVAMASYERTFFTNLSLNVQYDHSVEIHRLRTRNLNARRDITSDVPRSCHRDQTIDVDCVRPDPTKGNILNTESTGREEFHGLRVSYRQRLQRFQLSANYQMQLGWSDSLPSNNNGSQTQFGFSAEGLGSDQYNLRNDWARTAFPLHQINGSVNARLPMGIFLTQTVSASSGRAYTITTGSDDNKDSAINDRPHGFRRNSAAGLGQLTFSYAITKAFFIGSSTTAGGGRSNSGTNVNMYININNAFNRPNYNSPSGIMTSPNFGRSTSAGSPRQVELGFRFQF
jgi:hypothetical protein